MIEKKNIFAIIGSASSNSANLKLIEKLKTMAEHDFTFTTFDTLKMLPHFDPALSNKNTTKIIEDCGTLAVRLGLQTTNRH